MRSVGSRLLAAVSGLWWPRILWLAVGVTGVWSIGDALDGRSAGLRATIVVAGWLAWGIGVVALVVPSPLALTVMRMLSALSCGAAVISWIGGAAPAAGAVFVVCAVTCGVFIGGADFGQRCVQASAYGDERRFLLRAPVAFLLPVALAGLLWIAAVLAAPLLLGSKQWVVGGLCAVVAGLLSWLLLPRFNVLARRWLVLVPAGLVVHDQVVLAETLMVPRPDLVAIDLALAETEAADFTGPAGGHVVEVTLRSMMTITLARTTASPRGTALHVQSFIVAPTRPGAVLRATNRA
ncbi:MAG: hypothetical protein ACXV8L_01040 [Ilumatobacteraceae bacterium]